MHCGRAEGPISENINVHQKCRVVAHFVGKTALIMVPINFWRNSDPFKKKEHFSSSKIERVRAFFVNLSNFQSKISQIRNTNISNSFGPYLRDLLLKI